VTAFAVFATSIVLAGAPILSKAGRPIKPVRSAEQSLRGYYLAQFTNVVGSGLPESSFCFRFMPSGAWSNIGSEGFTGTYLVSGKALYASAVWLPSPAVFMSLQGSVNAKQGSGTYIISGMNGSISGGGTFAMTRAQNAGCS
jgi:hypothetical protein